MPDRKDDDQYAPALSLDDKGRIDGIYRGQDPRDWRKAQEQDQELELAEVPRVVEAQPVPEDTPQRPPFGAALRTSAALLVFAASCLVIVLLLLPGARHRVSAWARQAIALPSLPKVKLPKPPQLDATTDPEAHVDAKAARRAARAAAAATPGKTTSAPAEATPTQEQGVIVGSDEEDREEAESHSITIDSEPSGATVMLGAESLGVTPILTSNPVPAGTSQRLTITLAGHRPWTTTVRGGIDARVSAALVKLPAPAPTAPRR